MKHRELAVAILGTGTGPTSLDSDHVSQGQVLYSEGLRQKLNQRGGGCPDEGLD